LLYRRVEMQHADMTAERTTSNYILFYMDLLKKEETKMFRLQLKYGLWGWLTW